MECQVCVEDLGNAAFCLPCGHIYCRQCISSLQQQSTRSQSIQCPACRKVAPSGIRPDNIRKVFLTPTSPPLPTQSLQVRLQEAERERDAALRDLGRFNATRIDPFVRALDAKDALLATRNQELDKLRAELAQAKATIATVLPAKERHLCGVMEKFSHLAEEYQEEVAEHRKARRELQMKDAEIKKLKEIQGVEQPSTSVFTSMSTFIPTSLFNGSNSSSPDPDTTLVEAPEPKDWTICEPLSDQVKNQITDIPVVPQLESVEEPRDFHAQLRVIAPLPTRAPKVKPEQPKTRARKSGAEILWRGYGCPKKTPVPECTASDGYHRFYGSGTNQYATRYTCNICHFSCSESKRY